MYIFLFWGEDEDALKICTKCNFIPFTLDVGVFPAESRRRRLLFSTTAKGRLITLGLLVDCVSFLTGVAAPAS